MKTGIAITAEAPDKQSVQEVAKAIERILTVGRTNFHDQKTVRHALTILTELTPSVENVSISNTRVGDN